MRKSVLIFGAFGLILLIQEAAATLMLGSLLMALKGGMFAGKMGLGGLLAMALAGTQNQEGIATGGAYGRSSRTTRSVTSVSETPLDLKEPSNGTHLSAEKLANSLNNLTLPSTRRMMRQVAILDQLSCLPKVLCGLNTRTPSSKTSVINDYGYLIKFLFERDSDDADQEDEEQDDDDERDDDDEYDDSSVSRAEASVTKKTKKKANREGKPEDDDYDSKEEIVVDDEEFDKLSEDDDQLEEQAREELLQNEPEMLSYVLTEMRHKMKGKERTAGQPTPPRQYAIGSPYHTGGYPTYQPDHTYLPGYNKASYLNHPDTRPALNTDSAMAILSEPSTYTNLKGNGFKYGSPNFEFKIGASDKESKGGFLSSLLPSFSFSTVKNKGSSSTDKSDPFANDPFFSGFKRRSLNLPKESQNSKRTASPKVASGRSLLARRINSKFRPVDTTFVDLKREQLLNTKDPAQKYQIAAEVGQKTKSARQCRMLFAKCPYEYTEIMTMIENVKKLLNTQSKVGDTEVTLKQAVTAAPSTSTGSLNAKPVVNSVTSSGTNGNVINLAPGATPGVTSISHQLDSGDKVEIMLKFQPKEEKTTQPMFQIIPATFQPSPDRDLINATQSLLEMKRAIQAIQAINRLYNRTDLQFAGLQNTNPKLDALLASTQRPETTTSIAQRIISLKGTIPKASTTVEESKPAAEALVAHSESLESDSTSKSSEEVIVAKKGNEIKPQVQKKPVEEDDDSSSREDDDDDDDDDDEDEEEDDPEIVPDDPVAASRAQATFQDIAKPPVPLGGHSSGPQYQGHMYRNDQPIITSFHFEGLEPPKISSPRGKKRPAPLPPKPTRYKILRPKSKQRPRIENRVSKVQPQQHQTKTTTMPQFESVAKTTRSLNVSTAQTIPPPTTQAAKSERK